MVLFAVLEPWTVRAGRSFRMSVAWICPSCVLWAVNRNCWKTCSIIRDLWVVREAVQISRSDGAQALDSDGPTENLAY